MPKKPRAARVQLTENFYLDEFAVSSDYPELAAQIAFDELDTHKYFWLCKCILQPVRDHFRSGSIIITSGKRSEELNRSVGGSNTSQHKKAEAADWRFKKQEYNDIQLIQAFDYIRQHLTPAWHQVILYVSDLYQPQFIHTSIPSPYTKKHSEALIHFRGSFYDWHIMFDKVMKVML